MALWRRIAITPVFLLSLSAGSGETSLCAGFIPENDMQIPVTALNVGGVTQSEFNEVLDKVENYYAPIIQSRGARLNVNRDWNSPTVNASATRSGGTYTINMYGGLARHHTMTKDSFMLVACHELGHHIGGAPKVGSWRGDWASNEGQADYFANLRCMRFLLGSEDNSKWAKETTVDPVLQRRCEEMYSSQPEEYLCMRLGMAGLAGASLFHEMREEQTPLRFDTPDSNQVSRTFDGHPATQCRLDTYFQGGLCFHNMEQPLSDQNPDQGTCSERNGQRDGLRPRCWFRP